MAEMWKQPNSPWINQRWCIYTMEYHSALKRDEIRILATMWMNREDMLSKISRTQKDKYCMIPLA